MISYETEKIIQEVSIEKATKTFKFENNEEKGTIHIRVKKRGRIENERIMSEQ